MGLPCFPLLKIRTSNEIICPLPSASDVLLRLQNSLKDLSTKNADDGNESNKLDSDPRFKNLKDTFIPGTLIPAL